MRKYLMMMLWIIGGLLSTSAQIRLEISGKVQGNLKGFDQIYFYNRMSRDSAKIQDGRFQMTLQADEPELKFFYLQYQEKSLGMFTPVPLFFDRSGKLELSIDIENIGPHITMEGAETLVKVFQFQQEMQHVYKTTFASLSQRYPKDAFNEGNSQNGQLVKERTALLAKSVDSLLGNYLDGGAPLAEAYILLTQANGLPVARLEYYYDHLAENGKKSDFGSTVSAKIAGLKQKGEGHAVADFTLKNQDGKAISLKYFSGKYILVDFWASWCVPCRNSFPRIREVYQKLQGKPFAIVNISIDQNYQAWLKAVEEEQNPWTQLYDDQKVSYKYFNVQAVPTTFLIDPQGKIVLKEIGFDPKGGGAIERKLEEIFKMKF